MRILVAVNKDPYSFYAIDQVARLAVNTMAKVTILKLGCSHAVSASYAEPELTASQLDDPVLLQCRDRYLTHFQHAEDDPLQGHVQAPKLCMRIGTTGMEILDESHTPVCDLIALGCNEQNGCTWDQGVKTPQQIAADANCAVYIAKKNEPVDRVVCCLGREPISQRSLEMVSQFATLYGSRLLMVGLLERGELKSDIEKKLGQLISYYSDRDIEPWVEVVETRLFDDFVAYEARYALMALWMGKEALLKRIFSKSKMNRLIKSSESSVLVLR